MLQYGMAKKKPKKLPRDPMQRAKAIADMATGEAKPEEPPKEQDPIKAAAAELGRRGGLKGGKARAKKLTPEQRSEIARNAARLRWEHKKK